MLGGVFRMHQGVKVKKRLLISGIDRLVLEEQGKLGETAKPGR